MLKSMLGSLAKRLTAAGLCVGLAAGYLCAPVAASGDGPNATGNPAQEKIKANIRDMEKKLAELVSQRAQVAQMYANIPADEPYPDQVRRECRELLVQLDSDTTGTRASIASLKKQLAALTPKKRTLDLSKLEAMIQEAKAALGKR